MIKAVLFDMDDTLLDINLTAFMALYTADVSRMLAYICDKPTVTVAHACARGYLAMDSKDRADGLTNAELFAREVERRCGVPLHDPAIVDAITCYETDVLPKKHGGIVQARPMPGGVEAIEAVCDLGLTVALATNPCLTEQCNRTRMAWGGFADAPFARISHLENSTRLKPSARYYEEFVSSLGLAPNECLMVGNDSKRDFPRPDIGMPTAYVGHARPSRAVWSGRMSELACALPAIVDRLNLKG